MTTCTLTHDQHMATWQSFRDDCLAPDGCGFARIDVNQCVKGHPDDGVTMCGACGYPGKGIHDPSPNAADRAAALDNLGLDGTSCCGRRPPGVAGAAPVLACQLCPASPTYWRSAS